LRFSPEERIVNTQNATLFVRQFGSGDKHLIFIHGGPGWDHSYFLPYVLPLSQDFRLTFFDLRDCGRSKRKPSALDCERSYVDACMTDLSELMDSLHISQAVLLGFSFGGRVAMKFSERYPEKITALILASTTAYVDYRPELENQDLYRERMTPELKDELTGLWKTQGSNDGNLTRQIALASLSLNIFNISLIESAKNLINNIQFTDLWMTGYSAAKMRDDSARTYRDTLKRLSAPILILHGEKDLVFPLSCATRLTSELKEARVSLKTIPSAGHLTHFEKPEEWCAAVRDFKHGSEVF
jgi:pimeloyl-ACP methyl ester carboxylesterase